MIREKWLISPQYKETCIAILQENLFALRAKAAISQEELANLIGMSRQTYYGIETGKRKMSLSTYITLIFFFHNFNLTCEMVDDLKIYPIELIMKFNDEFNLGVTLLTEKSREDRIRELKAMRVKLMAVKEQMKLGDDEAVSVSFPSIKKYAEKYDGTWQQGNALDDAKREVYSQHESEEQGKTCS